MYTLCCLAILVLIAAVPPSNAQQRSVAQPQEVVEAYRVCNQFNQLVAEDLNFDRAFEATFVKDPKRRREIAIAEGAFGDADLTNVDDASLISAYKSRMQIAYLTLLVIDPDKKKLPDRLKAVYDHGTPSSADEFPAFAEQLKRNAADLRAYIDEEAARDPAAAERFSSFKKLLAKPLNVPTSYVVNPITAYSRGRVLDVKEEYYQIDSYSVVREGSQMRIIGIRFFTLF